MFWLKNKKIKFLVCTLNQRPDLLWFELFADNKVISSRKKGNDHVITLPVIVTVSWRSVIKVSRRGSIAKVSGWGSVATKVPWRWTPISKSTTSATKPSSVPTAAPIPTASTSETTTISSTSATSGFSETISETVPETSSSTSCN